MATENVTVLFTDLVGSTALASSLAQDAADALRREHFSILRRAIAETGGTEVKNLGDGLMVVFGAASAALACAVAMQQGVERDNRERGRSVGLRVGLSGGEVVKEEGADYFGDPVVEAARLCALCEAGQILAADVVRLMAGRRSRHECQSLGELQLKGLPEPVETVEVAWEPLTGAGSQASASIPLPSRLAFRPTIGVVGRETETGMIADAFKRVANGEGREVLLVAGEAGLGKTTLVAEATRAAFDDGACVLFGHCEEDLATPYQLFAEALGHYVAHAPEEQLVAHVAAHGSELSRLVPALARRIPDLPSPKATDADTERFLLFAAVVGLLTDASRQQPVVVVLDDLHWADNASLQLLRHFVAAEPSTRVLLLGTYRDNELSQAHALVETLAALRRQGGVSRVDLKGLDDTGVLEFLEASAGHFLDQAGVDLAHAVYRETDGNPFFVSEVLRHLAETGAIYQDASGRWVSDTTVDQVALPDSVREVIGARVLRLGPDAGRVLSTAAVIGRDFDLDVLARATNMSDDDLLDVLDAAATVALVREMSDAAGRYSFAHALIQHTLYEDLGPSRRARAHRIVAEALEDLCGDTAGARVGELARHWTNASQPIDVEKAIGYSRQAGDAALAALVPADALGYYTRAVDLLADAARPDPALTIDVAIGLGTAQRLTGDPAFRDTLLDAARQAAAIDDTDRLVAAALANDRGFFTSVGVIDTEKVAVLEAALERLPANHRDRALALATLCSELSYGSTFERRLALAEEAIAIAESSGDDATVVRVLNSVSLPLSVPPQVEQSLDRTAEAIARAEQLDDPVLLFWAVDRRAIAALHAGDIDEYHCDIERRSTLAEQLGQPVMQWSAAYGRAWAAQTAGDLDLAEQLATEALQVGAEGGQPDAEAFFGVQLAAVSTARGTLGELIPILEPMVTGAPEIGPAYVAALAHAHAQAGHIDQARKLLDEFAAHNFEVPMDQTWIGAMSDCANAAIIVRDPRDAGVLLGRLAPWADQWSASGIHTHGPVAHLLGGLAAVLGRYDEADAYFATSAASSDRAGAKFFAAQTALLWGMMLAERGAPGDVDRARELLTDARKAGTTNGYTYVERRAAETLPRLA
jgi:class 3 adenylate cyclase/tetratricopeptide (TPR) repeat protein